MQPVIMITAHEPYKAEPDMTSCCQQHHHQSITTLHASAPSLSLFPPVRLTFCFAGRVTTRSRTRESCRICSNPQGRPWKRWRASKTGAVSNSTTWPWLQRADSACSGFVLSRPLRHISGTSSPPAKCILTRYCLLPVLNAEITCGDACVAARVFFHSSVSDAGIIFAQHQDVPRCFWDDSFYFLCEHLPTFSGPCPVC